MRRKLGSKIIDSKTLGPVKLNRYRNRPSAFLEEVLGLQLNDYQRWAVDHIVSKCAKCGSKIDLMTLRVVCSAGCPGDPRERSEGEIIEDEALELGAEAFVVPDDD